MQNIQSRPLLSLLSLAMLLAALLLGCGAPESASIPEEPETVDEGAATAEVAAADPAQLPADFPADFPLPTDLTITEAQFTPGDAMTQANFLVRGTSESSVEEIASFYREKLPQAGYKLLQAEPPSPGASQALVYFQGENYRDASVQLSDEAGKTNVLISLPLRD